ncbi:DUF7064 domain-containing protein [Ornithinicoccus hortensis]|uniref:Hydroxyneurosporene synthase CrtC n=1 Tax=Ornithinicoccus hortensis TaxID=82346 RepID=A0A542YTC4_9MICO|nr:hypothetical protein [Ornithinicoccus hortensis]TQL51346.1 hypothetical protein FB467_2488 [Ornithinicoccus hortensis]
MIRPEDAQLHEPTTDDPLWGETNYFGFYLPEPAMNIGVYTLWRTNTGVINTNVSVNSQRVQAPWEADYWDAWAQVAIPQERSLLDYSLPNGLHVVCHEPNAVWDIRYEAGPARLDVRCTALMEPFDINDPEQDPLTAAAQQGEGFTWGHAYAGHFDMTARFTGELTLRGTTHQIDCVSTMDHSWGVRQERQSSVMSWMHAHFSEDLAVHGIFSFDPQLGSNAETPLSLSHGYVMDHGKVLGLTAGSGTSRRAKFYPEEITIQVTDETGRTLDLVGQAQTTFPWQAWPGTVGHNVLARWSSPQLPGQTGWGESMDFIGLEELTGLYARERS